MANWDNKRIVDAITEIEDEKFVLPVIQRSLVWTEEKMELLFDTLLKGDSFGGIMVIEEERDRKPLFSFRPFTKDGNFISSRQVERLPQNQLFVIDGQQRLQSFYIGLYGSINGKVLYFDLFSNYNSEYEFKFENDVNKLPEKPKDNPERPIQKHFWYSVKSLVARLKDTGRYKQVVREIIETDNITDETQKEFIEENILSFYENVLNSQTLGISKVIVNRTLSELDNRQRIVELFRRLNDGGTRLSSFDLVASILKGFSWEMEGFLREMLEEYQDIGLTQENLIKLLFLLQDNFNKEMAAIEASDANFAIEHKDRIKMTLKALKDFLIYAKLYDYYKDSNRSFIPLFFIAYHVFYKDISNESVGRFFDNYETGNTDFSPMKKWITNSLANGVFRSKGAGWIPYKTGIRKILNVVSSHKNKVFPTDFLFQVYFNHPITFTLSYNQDNINTLDQTFVFYMMYDLTRTSRTNDIDHVMPKNILEALDYSSEKINSIKNYQLLDYGTNRGEKNGKPFAQWVNSPIYVKDKSAYINIHLIPQDESIWDETEFKVFSEKRGELILNKILEHTK